VIYVTIVEDNPVAANLIREYIENPDIRVGAVYCSGEEALEAIPASPLPDLVLVDIGLPGMSGIEVTRKLKDMYPDLEIMIQTVFEDTSTIVSAIKAGASGYILKASTRDDITRAIMEVKKGGSFLSGKIARKIFQEFQSSGSAAASTPIESFPLTMREEEILRELIRGSTYKEIASRLDISVHTVNNHIRRIYEKLRVTSRGEAVARAIGSDIHRDNH